MTLARVCPTYQTHLLPYHNTHSGSFIVGFGPHTGKNASNEETKGKNFLPFIHVSHFGPSQKSIDLLQLFLYLHITLSWMAAVTGGPTLLSAVQR